MAKCQRVGCPNLRKGQSATASVFDERRAVKDKTYVEPHTEQWCVDCYQELEAHKYTYVIIKPGFTDRKLKSKRVPRIGKPGEVIVEAQVKLAASVPIEEGVVNEQKEALPLPVLQTPKNKVGRPPLSKRVADSPVIPEAA